MPEEPKFITLENTISYDYFNIKHKCQFGRYSFVGAYALCR
jgi:hypothetical protein